MPDTAPPIQTEIVTTLQKLSVRLRRESNEINQEINALDGVKPVSESDKRVEVHNSS